MPSRALVNAVRAARPPMGTDERRARARELRAAGWSLRSIAREVGVSYETARKDTRGVTPPPPGPVGRMVARRPSSMPATGASSSRAVVPAVVELDGDERQHQDDEPARRSSALAVRAPNRLARLLGFGAAPRANPAGSIPCEDCADERVRLPSGQFPAAIARDRATGRAVCDHHARARNGGRLRERDLGMLPNFTQPPPGQWRVTVTYPPRRPPDWAPLPNGGGNPTVDLSGWYG